MIDVTTAVELAQWSDQNRTKCEAEQVAVCGSVMAEFGIK
jgi:hypothetical protein